MRLFGIVLVSILWFGAVSGPALADPSAARQVVQVAVDELLDLANSSQPDSVVLPKLQKAMVRHAAISIIAPSVIGPEARQASPEDLRVFSDGFGKYLGRKYGETFREYSGGSIEISEVRDHGNERYGVHTRNETGTGKVSSIVWRVMMVNGRAYIYDLNSGGVSMLNHERREIRERLDRLGGDVAALGRSLAN